MHSSTWKAHISQLQQQRFQIPPLDQNGSPKVKEELDQEIGITSSVFNNLFLFFLLFSLGKSQQDSRNKLNLLDFFC